MMVSLLFFFKQKTAYEMRIIDWSSDVCSSDLPHGPVADAIAELGWIMIIGGAAIFLVVMALAAWAAFGPSSRPGWLRGNGMVVAGGKIGRASCRESVCQYV